MLVGFYEQKYIPDYIFGLIRINIRIQIKMKKKKKKTQKNNMCLTEHEMTNGNELENQLIIIIIDFIYRG